MRRRDGCAVRKGWERCKRGSSGIGHGVNRGAVALVHTEIGERWPYLEQRVDSREEIYGLEWGYAGSWKERASLGTAQCGIALCGVLDS